MLTAPVVSESNKTLTEEDFDEMMISLSTRIRATGRELTNVYAMETGGKAAERLAELLDLPLVDEKMFIHKKTIVVDTVSESGNTFRELKNEVGDFYSVALVLNYNSNFIPHIYGMLRKNKWIKFHWED